ncbi:MAG: hypothetical protein JOZ88_15230 [Hyphomicrobiales bacterium]|nr:hypothetical protein [Hyphomicrobiales bacterium]
MRRGGRSGLEAAPGGLAVGTLVGAAAHPYYYYRPPPYYYDPPTCGPLP